MAFPGAQAGQSVTHTRNLLAEDCTWNGLLFQNGPVDPESLVTPSYLEWSITYPLLMKTLLGGAKAQQAFLIFVVNMAFWSSRISGSVTLPRSKTVTVSAPELYKLPTEIVLPFICAYGSLKSHCCGVGVAVGVACAVGITDALGGVVDWTALLEAVLICAVDSFAGTVIGAIAEAEMLLSGAVPVGAVAATTPTPAVCTELLANDAVPGRWPFSS